MELVVLIDMWGMLGYGPVCTCVAHRVITMCVYLYEMLSIWYYI